MACRITRTTSTEDGQNNEASYWNFFTSGGMVLDSRPEGRFLYQDMRVRFDITDYGFQEQRACWAHIERANLPSWKMFQIQDDINDRMLEKQLWESRQEEKKRLEKFGLVQHKFYAADHLALTSSDSEENLKNLSEIVQSFGQRGGGGAPTTQMNNRTPTSSSRHHQFVQQPPTGAGGRRGLNNNLASTSKDNNDICPTIESFTGSCLCGKCQFEAYVFPSEIQHCYCSMCRRMSGCAFQTWAPVQYSMFKWKHVRKEDHVSNGSVIQGKSHPLILKRTTDHGKRHVCTECGTHLSIVYEMAAMQQGHTMWLALGTFDFAHEETFVKKFRQYRKNGFQSRGNMLNGGGPSLSSSLVYQDNKCMIGAGVADPDLHARTSKRNKRRKSSEPVASSGSLLVGGSTSLHREEQHDDKLQTSKEIMDAAPLSSRNKKPVVERLLPFSQEDEPIKNQSRRNSPSPLALRGGTKTANEKSENASEVEKELRAGGNKNDDLLPSPKKRKIEPQSKEDVLDKLELLKKQTESVMGNMDLQASESGWVLKADVTGLEGDIKQEQVVNETVVNETNKDVADFSQVEVFAAANRGAGVGATDLGRRAGAQHLFPAEPPPAPDEQKKSSMNLQNANRNKNSFLLPPEDDNEVILLSSSEDSSGDSPRWPGGKTLKKITASSEISSKIKMNDVGAGRFKKPSSSSSSSSDAVDFDTDHLYPRKTTLQTGHTVEMAEDWVEDNLCAISHICVRDRPFYVEIPRDGFAQKAGPG
ncbi:unnamed protein product [Amoebophrya sp. A120]|nr:unnamed protein product [Amoebophrya sp. A120]|eukprot:GSA120T00016212001.1